MTARLTLNSPFLLGFEQMQCTLDRMAKSGGDGYPPYNIEQLGQALRITLAVAGFAAEDLRIEVEGNQLVIRGRQGDDRDRKFLHRGIAARQFQKAFLLADGIEVGAASLDNGLLHVELERPSPETLVRRIEIRKTHGGTDHVTTLNVQSVTAPPIAAEGGL